MTSRERTLVRLTLVVAFCGAALWGYSRLVQARDAAAVAAENLAECRRLAARLGPSPAANDRGKAKAEPDNVDDDTDNTDANDTEGDALIRRIESSARSAGMPEDAIETIEPAPPVHRSDNAPPDRPTVVHLRGVTLRQMFMFLHAVVIGDHSGVGLPQVRLSAPAAADTGDRWSVEATLTELVRAPAPADARSEMEQP